MLEVLPRVFNPIYTRELKTLLDSTKLWENYKTGFAFEYTVSDFMDKVGQLYLDYFQFHLEETRFCVIEFQDLLPRLTPVINREYIYVTEHRLHSASEWDDPWITACIVGTNIEAFHDMFGNISGKLDAQGITKYMEGRKGDVWAEPDAIPKYAPPNHWWWFAKFEF